MSDNHQEMVNLYGLTNPNVKKHLVPYGTHTDNLKQYAWYPGGEEVAKKIVEDIKTFLSEE